MRGLLYIHGDSFSLKGLKMSLSTGLFAFTYLWLIAKDQKRLADLNR